MASSQAQEGASPEFSFYVSSDINVHVKVRIDKLIGCIPVYRDADMAPGGSVRPSALYATATLCDKFDELAVPGRTEYAEATAVGCTWDSWITFAPKYRDLGPSAQIAITIWEVREGTEGKIPLAGTTLKLFSKKGRLKSGLQTLKLWLGREGDTRCPSSTPGKVPTSERGSIGHVEHALKRYHRGEYEPVPWLDALSVKVAEDQIAKEKAAHPEELQLTVEFPSFLLPVLYQDMAIVSSSAGVTTASEVVSGTEDALSTPLRGTLGSGVKPGGAISSTLTSGGDAGGGVISTGNAFLQAGSGRMILIIDPEIGQSSPAEHKARKLAADRGLIDTGQRPNTEERERIDKILASPPGRPLQYEQSNLLWRFRFVLVNESRALTRFLKSVDWGDAAESAQALDLMSRWAQISTADALELLSPDYTVEAVRAHAVAALQNTTDDELLMYLLQLVQALRYEAEDASPLAAFLLDRAKRSAAVASALYWYTCAELEDSTFAGRAVAVQESLLAATGGGVAPRRRQQAMVAGGDESSEGGPRTPPASSPPSSQSLVPNNCIPLQIKLHARFKHLSEEMLKHRTADLKTKALRSLLAPGGDCSDLAMFECPCPLDPAVKLTGIIPSACSVFKSKVNPLKLTFNVHMPPSTPAVSPGSASTVVLGPSDGIGSSSPPQVHSQTTTTTNATQSPSTAAAELPVRLASLTLSILGGADGGGEATADINNSATMEASRGSRTSPCPQSPTTSTNTTAAVGVPSSPMDPSLQQQQQPPPTLSLIYKRGDDLRQDQLVLQLISLMDRLLKHEHLDLRITAYQVLPTSATDGIIEFVPNSLPLSQILQQHGTVHSFLMRHHPDPKGTYGLDPEVLNNYVRSCAGYSVFTHVLGIGDRHNDNVMITTDGRLFHIDFGFFLGRDPKFTTAPFVLNRAMVDAMGGADSKHYRQFVQLCCEAYNILRKSANLLLSLMHLMAGSSIEDIQRDPENALLKVQERLRLDLTDEEAAVTMQNMLAQAQAAILTRMAEAQHRIAQAWSAKSFKQCEVIVVDGGSTDGTISAAKQAGATKIITSQKGRGRQQNKGASAARGDILLFLHADSILPNGWEHAVDSALNNNTTTYHKSLPLNSNSNNQRIQKNNKQRQQQRDWGCFESISIQAHPLTSWIVRNAVALRTRFFHKPYGDQALFIRRNTFIKAGKFHEDWPLLEDLALVNTLKKEHGPPAIVPGVVETSGRRWQALGLIQTTLINQAILVGYALGVDVNELAKLYQRTGPRRNDNTAILSS